MLPSYTLCPPSRSQLSIALEDELNPPAMVYLQAKLLLLLGLFSGTLPALVLMMTAPVPNQPQFYDELTLVALCYIGSVIGGLFSIAMNAPSADQDPRLIFRRLALKACASALSGAVITPFLIENGPSLWHGFSFIRDTIATVLFFSIGISYSAVWLLHLVAGFIERRFMGAQKVTDLIELPKLGVEKK